MKQIILLTTLFLSTQNHCVANKIGIISIPKSGTHLVAKLLKKITHKSSFNYYFPTHASEAQFWNDHILFNHQPWTKEEVEKCKKENIKVVFISRDPRDKLVSTVSWTKNNNIKNACEFSDADLLNDLIHRLAYWWEHPQFTNLTGLSVKDYYDQFMPWEHEPFVYATTFEKLVGSRGGGNDEAQRQEIINIAHHIGVELTAEEITAIQNDLFGSSFTFRKGQIGAWKKTFTQKDKNDFKAVAGQLLIDMEYEKDFNW